MPNKLHHLPALLLIRSYQYGISPLLGCHCRFEPSCSEYTKEAICLHGLGKGIWLGIKRVMRCQPFGGSGFDPVTPNSHPE